MLKKLDIPYGEVEILIQENECFGKKLEGKITKEFIKFINSQKGVVESIYFEIEEEEKFLVVKLTEDYCFKFDYFDDDDRIKKYSDKSSQMHIVQDLGEIRKIN